MGIITGICISEAKGTAKYPVEQAELVVEHGLLGDAHAGSWHRQVSILSQEKIDAFRARGAQVAPGAFGENLIVQGIDLSALPVGSRLRSGSVLLELTQIGKECHHGCAIFQAMGDCIMPREGVFCRVLAGGILRTGDMLKLIKEAQT